MAKKEWKFPKNILPEGIFVVSLFVLTMMHEWIQMDSILSFAQGVIFFLVLYGQAQFHRFFIFPLLLARRIGLYAVLAFLSTLLGAVILLLLDYYWIDPGFYHESGVTVFIFLYHFALSAISTIALISLFLMRQYSREVEKRSEAQLLLNEMNIKLLHAQLNPHFFFNVLNNLYGVSLTDPSRVPGLILKLSDLMRYQLENGNKPLVSLSEEVNYILNYISMEKERIGKRCEIEIDVKLNSEMAIACKIAPLILITLVENAFKHSLTIRNKWFVHISISRSGDDLHVSIRNSLPDTELSSESTGLGLANTRERLELLYKNRYNFNSGVVGEAYQTTLILQLNSL